MKLTALCVFLVGYLNVYSQLNLKISFKPYNLDVPYQFNTTVSDLSGAPFKITTLYYYISNIHIIHDGGQDLDLSDTVLIVKNDENIFDFGNQPMNLIEQINFGVGVPLNKNHLDISTYPIGHPLSFQFPSMQWGWASGYNLVGIVGEGDVNQDWITENAFELFSLGDDLYRNVQLPINASNLNPQNEINIRTNIEQLISNINTATVGYVHSGVDANITLMDNIINFPVFTLDNTAKTNELTKNQRELYYSTLLNGIKINWTNFIGANSYQLINLEGNIISKGLINSNKGELTLNDIQNGIYFFVIHSQDGTQLKNLRIVK